MSVQPLTATTGDITADTTAPTQMIGTQTTKSIIDYAADLDAAFKLANAICGTSFVPKHFQGKPHETAIAMMYGDTLGIPAIIAPKSIYVVHGTPALYAQAMYSLALSRGHQIERVYADNERVEFRCRRRGQQSWQKVEWTIARAKQAGYTSNTKYRENPIGMLTEKCKAEAAKLVAGDVLAGLNSVEEIELGDYSDTPAPVEAEKPKTRVTRKPRKDAAPAPEKPPVVDTPPVEDEPATATDAAPGEEPWRTQWVELIEAMKAAGMQIENPRGKDSGAQWLAKASELAGASWTHPNQISPEAAAEVFQMLATPTADEATGEIVDEPTA